MLVELMSPYNHIQVNVKLINVFGLNVATYWSELLNIYSRVINKKKDELLQSNGFFLIDRDYITSRTSLDRKAQTVCDTTLINIGVLAVDEQDPNKICISLNTMFEIITEDDAAVLYELQKKAKVKKATTAETKKAMIAVNLKKAITVTDPDLVKAYHTWVDSYMAGQGKPLTKEVVTIFQRKIQEYSTSKAIQLRLIEIATVQHYREADWAINIYEKDTKKTGTFIGVKQKENVGIDLNSVF